MLGHGAHNQTREGMTLTVGLFRVHPNSFVIHTVEARETFYLPPAGLWTLDLNKSTKRSRTSFGLIDPQTQSCPCRWLTCIVWNEFRGAQPLNGIFHDTYCYRMKLVLINYGNDAVTQRSPVGTEAWENAYDDGWRIETGFFMPSVPKTLQSRPLADVVRLKNLLAELFPHWVYGVGPIDWAAGLPLQGPGIGDLDRNSCHPEGGSQMAMQGPGCLEPIVIPFLALGSYHHCCDRCRQAGTGNGGKERGNINLLKFDAKVSHDLADVLLNTHCISF